MKSLYNDSNYDTNNYVCFNYTYYSFEGFEECVEVGFDENKSFHTTYVTLQE